MLSGHEQGVPCFLARSEQNLSFQIVGNVVLIEAFVEHHPKNLKQNKSSIGDGINVSIMNLRIGLAYHVWDVLQDSPL